MSNHLRAILIISLLGLSSKLVSMSSTIDHYESIGRISTVIICASLVIIAMAGYMLYIDRRLKKLEEDISHENRL